MLTLVLGLMAIAPAGPDGTLHAQRVITSDRPGIGSGSAVLPRGTTQIELGYELSRASDLTAHSIGQALLRIGFDAFELGVFGNSYVAVRGEDADGSDFERSGTQPLGVGGKVPVARGVGDRMDVSLQSIVTTDWGTGDFGGGGDWDVAINALADIALNERAALAVNAGWIPTLYTDAVSLIITPSLSAGDGVGVYAGYAGSNTLGWTHILEGGLKYLTSSDTQLDLNGGFDVEGGFWFLGVGMATQWR